MDTYTVSFFGHRVLHDLERIDTQIIPLLKELLKTKPYVSFLIGRQGEFDIYVASVIKRVQKEVGKESNELTLVLPYAVVDLPFYEIYYDSIIIPECLQGTHPKSAITQKNRWMIEQSDLVITLVDKETGGAYTALKYAKKWDKKIIRL